MEEPLPQAVVDDAIGWVVKLRFGQPRPAMQARFDAWLAASPAHALAWQRVSSMDSDLDQVPRGLAVDTLGPRNPARRRALKVLGWSGAVAAGGWLTASQVPWWAIGPSDTTGVGGQRRLPFDDGTVVTLNTQTALDTAYAQGRRVITLSHGEVHVAMPRGGAAHPLTLRTRFGEAEATTARFVARLHNDATLLSVLEGTLHLASGHDATREARAGETWQLASGKVAPATPLPFDPDGWMDGVIAGQHMRLADLLAELSRYRHGRVHCSAAVADLRVSGVYQVRDTDQALRFLAQTQPVKVVYRTRFWVDVVPAQNA